MYTGGASSVPGSHRHAGSHAPTRGGIYQRKPRGGDFHAWHGTLEAINLVAASYGSRFSEGDEVILTVMEHHADIVPWQLLQSRTGIKLRVVDIDERGVLDLEQYRSLFGPRTVMAAFCHVSNVLGTVNPV